ncbi:hypothetical protein [Luteimonas mephitis]|uniref:hypothetical protein n=1 Tax=Luteimonas mephitis TaxID=83615 RepID=UPI000A028431|nr:hypothetical protein [Luteimonas mephitis]
MSSKKKRAQRRPHGYCKLTHRPGAFVDSHIIPEALTRPTIKGNALFQYGEGPRPSRRWTSWYDSQLVTREGEDYLSALDTWAIAALREHKLVWSGWGDEITLGSLHTPINHFLGVREVRSIDTKRLRLFFLSLLWRAAASSRSEFKEISVPATDLEQLRLAILGLEDPDLNFYPIQLTQLSSKGIMHNQTPYPDIKYAPNLEDPNAPEYELPTFRFYMDGLIAHVHREMPPSYNVVQLGNLIVGVDFSLVLSTVTFEDSLQAREMLTVLGSYEAHPSEGS